MSIQRCWNEIHREHDRVRTYIAGAAELSDQVKVHAEWSHLIGDDIKWPTLAAETINSAGFFAS